MTTPLTRHGAMIKLRPEKEADYRQLHADVWPSVRDALTRANISNYSIFLRDGVLFSYFEYRGRDLETDLRTALADDGVRGWLTLTDACQVPIASASDGEWWAPAEELFHLD